MCSIASLGGFTALVSAIGLPEQVSGVVLLNSAGQFGNPNSKTSKSEESALQKVILKPLKEAFQRIVLGFLFWQAKQPARIVSVLKSVSHLLGYMNTRTNDHLWYHFVNKLDAIAQPSECLILKQTYIGTPLH